MAHATQAQMRTALGDGYMATIANVDNDDATLTAPITAITDALDAASSLIDSYISAYLPFSTVPPSIVRATITVALHLIVGGRENETQKSRNAYDDVMLWLRDIAKGLATITDGTGLDPDGDTVNGADPEVEAEDRQWTRSNMRSLF